MLSIRQHDVKVWYHDGMRRMQVQLDDSVAKALREEARKRGISISSVVRESVEAFLARDREANRAAWERALSVVGEFALGPGDVSRNHDAYLGDVLAEELRERR